MTEDQENLDSEDESDSEPAKRVLPWLTGVEAFTQYKKTVPMLKELVKSKRVRTRKVNGRDMYSAEDLEALPEDEDGSTPVDHSMADLLRAAVQQITQVHRHDEVKFDKYTQAYDRVLNVLERTIEKLQKRIEEQDLQEIKMREATEKVFNLEHERKMGELREERTRNMQTKALDVLQKTLGPWIVQKLGGALPGAAGEPGAGTDPRLAMLGQSVVAMVVEMSEERFAALGNLIPAEEFAVLTAIREGMKT